MRLHLEPRFKFIPVMAIRPFRLKFKLALERENLLSTFIKKC